jgi:hypothetical protein
MPNPSRTTGVSLVALLETFIESTNAQGVGCAGQHLRFLMALKRRHVARVVCAAMLIVLVGVSALFVVNRFRWFVVSHRTATQFRNLTVSNGAVWYGRALMPAYPGSEGWGATAAKRMGPQDSNFDPVRWLPLLRSKPNHVVIVIPLWMIALPSGAVAAWTYLISRQRPGHCECGYKLAGLPVQAPCPECGRARVEAQR